MSIPADDHPTTAELQAFLQGRIDSGRAAEVSDHVQQCDRCGSVVERLDATHGHRLTRGSGFDFNPLAWKATTAAGQDGAARATDPPLASVLHPGLSVGDYRLEEFLGEGGNGVVFRGVRLKPFPRAVAIKFAKLASHPEGRPHRAALEQQTLASLRHPNIPHFYDAGVTEHGIHYLVMELVEGVPLSAVTNAKPLTVDESVRLIRIVCDVVEYAHRSGVIHRDLKPSNILIERDGRSGELDLAKVKVIDFGIAKMFADGSPSWTRSHELIGTLEYMSPEQLAVPPRCDTRSDVRAIGVVLYELFAGRLPFPTEELAKLPLDQAIQRLRCDDPPPPSHALTDSVKKRRSGSMRRPIAGLDISARARQLRKELDWIVMKAIDRDPERRYPSVAALADDLDRFRRGEVIHAAPPSSTRRAMKWALRHRVFVATAVVLLTSLLGAGILTFGFYWETIERNRELAWRTYVGEIQRAQILLDRGHHTDAIAILNRHREDQDLRRLRGIESRLLWAQSHTPSLVAEVMAFPDQVDDLDVSPDGKCVAALSRTHQQIRVFAIERDVASLNELNVLSADELRAADPGIARHWNEFATIRSINRLDAIPWGDGPHPLISCLRYSPEGRSLAIGTFSGTILLWNIKDSKIRRVIRCDDDVTHRLEFSPNGRWLAATGNRVRLIDLADEATKAFTLFDKCDTGRLDFSPDSRFLIASDADRELHIWDINSRAAVLSRSLNVENSPGSTVRDVRFSPDGKSVLNVMSNSGIYLRSWNGEHLGDPQLIGATRNGGTSLRFSSTPSQLATSCDGALLQYWDVDRAELRDVLVGHSGRIGCLAYSPAQNCFITGGDDGFVRCYRADGPPTLFRAESAPSCIAIRPDGERLLLGFPDGQITILDTRTAAVVDRLGPAALGMAEPAPVTGLGYFADGERVAILCRDGRIALWTVQKNRWRWFQTDAIPIRLLIDPGQQWLCAACRDGQVIVLDKHGDLRSRWSTSPDLTAIQWYAAERQFVTCHERGTLNFWDMKGQLRRSVKTDPQVRTIAVHPTEDLFIGYGLLGRLVAIDPSNGWVVREFSGHRGGVDKVLVLDGGSRLMSIASDFTTRFWEFHSGEELLMRDERGRHCRRLQSDARQRLLVTVHSDRTVHFGRIGDDTFDRR